MLDFKKMVAGSVLFINCFSFGNFAHAEDVKVKSKAVNQALSKEVARIFVGTELLARKTAKSQNKLNDAMAVTFQSSQENLVKHRDSGILIAYAGLSATALAFVSMINAGISLDIQNVDSAIGTTIGLTVSSAVGAIAGGVLYTESLDQKDKKNNEAKQWKFQQEAFAQLQSSIDRTIDDTAYIFGKRLDDNKKRNEIKISIIEKIKSGSTKLDVIDLFADHGLISSAELKVFKDLQALAIPPNGSKTNVLILSQQSTSELTRMLMNIKESIDSLQVDTNLKSEERNEIAKMREDLLISIDTAVEILSAQ